MTEAAAGSVMIRYWAAARAAAGVREERVEAHTLEEALQVARSRHDAEFSRLLAICSLVVDEIPAARREPATVLLGPDSVVEVLPPFAGGAGAPLFSMRTTGGARRRPL